MIRKVIALVALCLAPSVVSAQTMGGYVEGNIGAAFISDADAHINISDLSATATGDYGTELLFGLEAGISGLANADNLRLGLSWDRVSADLNSLNVSGSDFVGPFTFNGNCPDPRGFCSAYDKAVNIVAANAYFDLPLGNTMGVQPFIGVGAGMAFFEDTDSELALSGTLGARIPLGENVYLGGRYRFQWIAGPTDDLGLKFDPIKTHGLSAIVGVNF